MAYAFYVEKEGKVGVYVYKIKKKYGRENNMDLAARKPRLNPSSVKSIILGNLFDLPYSPLKWV